MIGAPKKHASEKHQDFIKVMLTSEQRKIIEQAAKQSDSPASTWLRSVGIREAKKILKNP